MTKLGEFFKMRSVNRAGLSRKTGIGTTRLSQLANHKSARLQADELYLISLALKIDPNELLMYVCKGLKLLD